MKVKRALSLYEKYPPSAPCSCDICKSYCRRPGWWTVDEAARAMEAGYAGRMMLEMDPLLTFGVLSPAFRGCEQNFSLQVFSNRGCTFLEKGLCELHGTGFQPLECRFCHHARPGLGIRCHQDIEADWNTQKGKSLIGNWIALVKLKERYGL